MRASDVLPDHVNEGEFDGITVRKGSVGAFLANARILANRSASPEACSAAERDILELLPALRALGLFDVFEIRDEKLRVFVDTH